MLWEISFRIHVRIDFPNHILNFIIKLHQIYTWGSMTNKTIHTSHSKTKGTNLNMSGKKESLQNKLPTSNVLLYRSHD